MDSVLRPRDIQARIRSGESPETVAAAAQTTVDRIMGFATPVLAERAYVAQQAQKASVRRRAGEGQVGQLGEAVAARLESLDVDPEAVEWDSWRREDGRWTLVADFVAGRTPKHAQFIYDVAGRYVVADDDESRWLVGERSAANQTSQERTAAEDDHQLPLGDDAIALVTGVQPGESSDRRSSRGPSRGPSPDWISTQASDRPAAPVPPPAAAEAEPEPVEAEPSEALFEASEVAPAPETDTGHETGHDAGDDVGDVAPGDAAAEEPRKPTKPARSRGRASVPSWDEIMFGTPKDQ